MSASVGNRRRLRSLLELMHLFNATGLMTLQFKSGLWILKASQHPKMIVDAEERGKIAVWMASLKRQLSEYGMVVSGATVERILKLCEREFTYEDMGDLLMDLAPRLNDEFAGRWVLMLTAYEASLLEPKEAPFGSLVAAKFPKCTEDISESGKCLALGRHTACVFHLARAMESAVARIGRKLKVTIVDRDNKQLVWGKILANINKAVEGLPKGKKRDDWSAACGFLYHAKQAWRNDTMHPKQTYTEEEATEVFRTVRAFMNQLAKLL